MKKILLLAWLSIFVGCASIDESLWKPLPDSFVVKEKLSVKVDAWGSGIITIPAGTYSLWKSDPRGYLYRNEGVKFELDESFNGSKTHNEFEGVLMLSNRKNEVLIGSIHYKIKDMKFGDELGIMYGELGRMYVRNELKKKGYSLTTYGLGLTEQQRKTIGLGSGKKL